MCSEIQIAVFSEKSALKFLYIFCLHFFGPLLPICNVLITLTSRMESESQSRLLNVGEPNSYAPPLMLNESLKNQFSPHWHLVPFKISQHIIWDILKGLTDMTEIMHGPILPCSSSQRPGRQCWGIWNDPASPSADQTQVHTQKPLTSSPHVYTCKSQPGAES